MKGTRWNTERPGTALVGHMCLGMVLLLLVACGATEALTPEQAHEQYVAAVRAKDRQKVLALTVDRGELNVLHVASVDQQMERMQIEIAGATGDFPTGPLSHVEILPLVTEGEGQVGYSRWIYPERTICHQAVLQQTPQGWRVVAWYDSITCGS